jgi:hypothetical protein
MAWFKVDDGFHASRKLLKIGKRSRFAAVGLWTVAGSWAADQLTDGHVPDYMIAEWGAPPAAPDALVDAGLWERTHDGYVFYNWHEYQPSKQDVDAERAASRERMRDLRAKRKQRKPLEQAEEEGVFGRTDPNSSESVRNPDPTRPDPTRPIYKEEAPQAAPPPKKSSPERGTRIPEDFAITPAMYQWASSKGLSIDLHHSTEKFINHWTASTKNATKRDWVAAWRNWMLGDQEKAAPRMDHSARGLAKGVAMMAAWDAKNPGQDGFLEIEV